MWKICKINTDQFAFHLCDTNINFQFQETGSLKLISLSYTLEYLTQKLLPGVQIIWGQKLKFVKLFQFIYFMLVQFHVPTTWFYQSINNFTSRLSVNLPKRIYNSSSNWDTQVLVKLIISFQKKAKMYYFKKTKETYFSIVDICFKIDIKNKAVSYRKEKEGHFGSLTLPWTN